MNALAMNASDGRSRETAHQYVTKRIRKWILSGAVDGGARLMQGEIAAALNVSTTPVREALRDLVAEGLVRLDANRGAVVREINLTEMKEIYDLRGLLEPYAIARATSVISVESLDHAARVLDEMESCDDVSRTSELNRDFHAILVDSVGSERLSSMLKSLRDVSSLFTSKIMQVNADTRRVGEGEHRQILDACRRRDRETAIELIRIHLQGALASMENLAD